MCPILDTELKKTNPSDTVYHVLPVILEFRAFLILASGLIAVFLTVMISVPVLIL
jgi:hypothetical protein